MSDQLLKNTVLRIIKEKIKFFLEPGAFLGKEVLRKIAKPVTFLLYEMTWIWVVVFNPKTVRKI